jgi:hypothetical protein
MLMSIAVSLLNVSFSFGHAELGEVASLPLPHPYGHFLWEESKKILSLRGDL